MSNLNISDGYFSVLYRGFGSRKADKIDKEELLGFHFLTDTICNSHGMRQLISKLRKEGNNESEAFKKAKNLHARTLIDIFDTIESSKELYLNEKNKDKNDALIARLSASPSASVVSPTTKRSNEKLPDCIQKAWNDYIARLRRKQ